MRLAIGNLPLNLKIKPRMYVCIKKLHFISRNWHKENSTVASVSSPIQIHYFDYPKPFINRINEVYDFSVKYCDILLKKKHINI